MTRGALIVGSAPAAGSHAFYHALIGGSGLLIAADGGLALCLAAGRIPDVCVGDFDSVAPSDLHAARAAGAQVIAFPADKDASDLDLAVQVARGRSATTLCITAAFSGRIDHTLAALGTLARASDLAAVACEPGWRGYPLDVRQKARLELAETENTVVSLFAWDGPAIVSTSGLRYQLTRAELQPLSSLGLSNVALDGTQHIEVHAGRMIVVVNEVGANGC